MVSAEPIDVDVDDEDVSVKVVEKPMFSANKGKSREGQAALNEPDTLPWVEKYRPQSLDDVVAHQDIISTINRFIEANRLPHLLLYGPPGTGKTSTILACARKIYGKNYKSMSLELNASDDRGIDVVREQIKNFASTRQMFMTGYKLIILDEADAMTYQAQNALRRIIEKYTKNVRFCIICNYVNKITPAIQSRCTRFRFQPLPIAEVSKRLSHVIASEHCNVTPDGLEALLKLSKGDMRRGLNVLQACYAAYESINEDAVYSCVGNPHPSDIERIVQSMMSDEFGTSLQTINNMRLEKGLALQDILGGVYELLQSLEIPNNTRIFIIDQLAIIEHRLSTGSTEKLQLSAMVAAVKSGIDLPHD